METWENLQENRSEGEIQTKETDPRSYQMVIDIAE